MAGLAAAQSPDRPRLHTNEAYIDEATRTTTLAINDPIAVFAFVLDSLPERVKVYPTENFYYFRFIYQGVPYAGNIRLDPLDRDNRKVAFVYYPDIADWTGGPDLKKEIGLVLDGSNQVAVERVEPLVYRISYRGKSVTFVLNDLSQVKPPTTVLGPDEKFLGPVFDESAIRFFLVFNAKQKIFLYILDETVKAADEFIPAKRTNRILIGRRTSFAFYRDHRLDRKILIGVFDGNRRVNNYFDGPFDQLPENFIQGETLRESIIEADPSAKGRIDRFGYYADYPARYSINPYIYYQKEHDLYVFHQCATNRAIPAEVYYKCFDENTARAMLAPGRSHRRRN
ncbi:MAG: hypothetical protein HYS06_06170 [Methylocystis sp.]|nr:hypothetical protein [Methylocystis sp.]